MTAHSHESMLEVTSIPSPETRIKWGYAMASIPDLPQTYGQGCSQIRFTPGAPMPGDILVAEVGFIGRHTRIDLIGAAKSNLFEGDLVGMVFAPRYATRQFQAIVPDSLDEVHFLCAGGVCGRVISIPDTMNQPTELLPVGYLLHPDGHRVNLRESARKPIPQDMAGIKVFVAVGSAMDSGKTTAAYSLINGLTRAGVRVGAAKLTGTASAKDPRIMGDAGADQVFDFTDFGFGSTADIEYGELEFIVDSAISNLAAEDVDAIVLEVADGVTQRETMMMLKILANRGADGALYTCNDALGVCSGIDRVRKYGLNVLAVSGMVTSSTLSTQEARNETDVPVLTREDLRNPAIAERLRVTPGGTKRLRDAWSGNDEDLVRV